MSPKLWNPRAQTCQKCGELKPIKDKKTKTVDPYKKLCQKFGWEIMNELAEKQPVCKILPEKHRKKK